MKKYFFLMCIIIVALHAKRACIGGLRAPSKPFISGDGFRAIADHVYDNTDTSLQPEEIAFADIIFVKTDDLESFFNNIHPKITTAYILISHNSDYGAPGNYVKYLNDPKLLRWYGQNPTVRHHDKFEAIPIGIINRYIEKIGDVDDYFKFNNFRNSNTINKDILVGINFHVETFNERHTVFDMFSSQSYCQSIFAENHFDYLVNMSRCKYILSPRGNGLDCHRTWEALLVGSIPIVSSSEMDELFQDMPIMIVKDWSEINQQFLEEQYDDYYNYLNAYSLQKITYSYWEKHLLETQYAFRLEQHF